MSNWKNDKTDALINALLSLKNKNEAQKFLRDLLTEKEILEFGNRLEAAKMLENKTPYTKIEAITGLSSATIARISKWLKKGMGGYKLILKRLHHHTSHNSACEKGVR